MIGGVQAVPDHFDHPLDAAEFKRPPHRPGVELYRAHIVRHAFEPHTHEAFGLGAIESGVERFRYRGTEHLAPADTLVLMNPDELHTGRAETSGGWRYRMLYLDDTVLEQLTGERGWWFAEATDRDATRARRVSRLLRQLWHAHEPLAFDGLLLSLIDELRPSARIAQPARDEGLLRFAPVLDYLRAHLAQRVTLDELAAVVGLSPFHFLRQFKRAHHATPQQMLMALRLFEAKQLLAAGEAPAQVAAAVGLTDQAHLTHAFANRYGVTPARYQQQLGTRPKRGA
jgi:AraC-like DNA-binding protein